MPPPKYFPKNRKPQKEEIIPFLLKKPVELKSAIQGAGSRERGQVCTYELSLLLSCLKVTSFSEIACTTEINNFQKCFSTAKKTIQPNSKGETQKNKSFLKEEVNKLLKKYSN